MAGIYIHIPFCRQKCYYCDFYKTVNKTLLPRFINALKKEILLRKTYLQNKPVQTIYFGGGTPSVLNPGELETILKFLAQEFEIIDPEITFEANPDDLSTDYLKAIFNIGINRLSIGVQSFDDDLLKKMNRRHHAQQAINVIKNAAEIGFKNLSADLIYGLPGLTINKWKESLAMMYELPVQHLSAYHLTYHEGTPFYTWLKKGTLKALNEKDSLKQFEILMDSALTNDFEQYEISNFAKNKRYSKHNSSYWKNVKYLGLGPSAHSYDGNIRSWNISHTEGYINAIENEKQFSEKEDLTDNDKFNEFILTGIRTKWGVSIEAIKTNFGEQKADYFLEQLEKYDKTDLVHIENGLVTLTRKGIFVSDDIMSNLIYI